MRACTMLLVLGVAPAVTAEDKPAVKEIPTKDLKLKVTIPEKHDVTKPHEAKSQADLAKVAVLTPDAATAVGKQVDFTKDKVVVFWWAGSGQDKLEAGELKGDDKKTTATFTYTPGRTRDLRAHFHLFTVPKDAVVEVKK